MAGVDAPYSLYYWPFLPGRGEFVRLVLVHGELRLAQMPNICAWLAARHGLVPDHEDARAQAMQLQLTVADLVAEAHDTHHPVAKGDYYEAQKAEARRYAAQFVAQRMPKFLHYFEAVLQANEVGQGRHLLGSSLTYGPLDGAGPPRARVCVPAGPAA